MTKVESYGVGIDLGTTNAVVAFTALAGGEALGAPQVLPIGQWVAQEIWQERPLFPTFRYHTLPHEAALLSDLPFPYKPLSKDFPVLFGEYAVKLGAQNRGQAVASAKSWLSQASRVHQDAKDAFLPFGSNQQAQDSVPLVSPLIASASYLHYIHCWWNYKFPEFPLNEQSIVITVPASFDEYARDLTLAAAEFAGLTQITLLEEPTAAAYAWRADQQVQNAARKSPGIMCVLDIGGGTTDLSVIDFRDQAKPRRIAVGEHLMLGGDNLDAALAQKAWAKMDQAGSTKVSPAQWSQLMVAARALKEQAFSPDPPRELTLSVLGRGKSLIAKQRQALLDTVSLQQELLNGFLPQLDFEHQTQVQQKTGLVQVGLKFEANPAITAHLLEFLRGLNQQIDSVLLNGGFFQGEVFCEQIARQFATWSDQRWGGRKVDVLRPRAPQEAVALGAALYSVARQLKTSTLIGGGASRSLVLALESNGDTSEGLKGLVVMAKGTEESVPVTIEQSLDLQVNSPVQFLLYSTAESVGAIGDVVVIEPAWLSLPPLQTIIELDQNDLERVSVKLISELTSVGALQLQFKSAVEHLDVPPTYLEFAGRSATAGVRIHKDQLPSGWPRLVEGVTRVYGPKKGEKADEKGVMAELRKVIDSCLGPKQQWDMSTCRSLVDLLLRWKKNRRRSARHEALWLSLVGYSMRPGHGAVGDGHRMEHILTVINSGPAHHEHSVWHAWWTLIRRCAGGFDAASQRALFQLHEPKIKGLMEYMRLAGRASAGKSASAQSKVNKLKAKGKPTLSKKEQDLKSRAPEWMLPAIARLECLRGDTWFEESLFANYRSPCLGVTQQVIAWCCAQVVAPGGLDPQSIEPQVHLWLKEDWSVCPEFGLAASVAVRVRKGMHSLPEELRVKVELALKKYRLPKTWVESIRIASSANDSLDELSGEPLPQGLRIRVASN